MRDIVSLSDYIRREPDEGVFRKDYLTSTFTVSRPMVSR